MNLTRWVLSLVRTKVIGVIFDVQGGWQWQDRSVLASRKSSPHLEAGQVAESDQIVEIIKIGQIRQPMGGSLCEYLLPFTTLSSYLATKVYFRRTILCCSRNISANLLKYASLALCKLKIGKSCVLSANVWKQELGKHVNINPTSIMYPLGTFENLKRDWHCHHLSAQLCQDIFMFCS